MSTVRFYNRYSFSLPASPGDAATLLTLAPSAGGDFMGVEMPISLPPLATDGTSGCSANSSVLVTRYRYSFLGAKGLRPAVGHDSYIGFFIGRTTQPSQSPGHPGQGYFSLPYTDSENWVDCNIFADVKSGNPPPQSRILVSSHDRFLVDTRNLQSLYYGQVAELLIEIDAQCVLQGI